MAASTANWVAGHTDALKPRIVTFAVLHPPNGVAARVVAEVYVSRIKVNAGQRYSIRTVMLPTIGRVASDLGRKPRGKAHTGAFETRIVALTVPRVLTRIVTEINGLVPCRRSRVGSPGTGGG